MVSPSTSQIQSATRTPAASHIPVWWGSRRSRGGPVAGRFAAAIGQQLGPTPSTFGRMVRLLGAPPPCAGSGPWVPRQGGRFGSALRPRFGSFADELLDLSHLTVAGRSIEQTPPCRSQAFPGTDQLGTRARPHRRPPPVPDRRPGNCSTATHAGVNPSTEGPRFDRCSEPAARSPWCLFRGLLGPAGPPHRQRLRSDHEDRHWPTEPRSRSARLPAPDLGETGGAAGLFHPGDDRPGGLRKSRLADRAGGGRRGHRAHRAADEHSAVAHQATRAAGQGGRDHIVDFRRAIHPWSWCRRPGGRLRQHRNLLCGSREEDG